MMAEKHGKTEHKLAEQNRKREVQERKAKQTAAKSDDLRYSNADKIYGED